MNIVAIGYPFSRPNNRTTLTGPETFFIVPKVWKIKKGKAEYRTAEHDHIMTTSALFHHSGYPFIGGLLKGWMPLLPLYLWRLKKRHGIELVFDAHEPNLLTTLYNGFFCKLLGLKHVVFSWQNVALRHRWLIKINLWFADGVVCGNQKCLNLFKQITQKPLTVIPLAGLDPDFWQPKPRQERSTVTFLFVGAIDYRKGVHLLVEAFQKIPHAKLVLVGSGSYEKNIHHPIIPWADHPTLMKLYQEADVFVYPSISHGGWEEQFGYSMAEASLMELPVISTHTGSIDEIVVDGSSGILVESEHSEKLAEAMMKLATDEDLRRRMGSAGRTHILQHYANSIVAKKFHDFFKTL
ncbi:MAG: glycosyltransferase family 4 protein [Patescibacteria group bacterium]